MKIRPFSISFILIMLAGYALRLYGLGAQSLWYDETVSAVLAQKSLVALIAHTARDIHPPGYYALLHGWTLLAGDSEFALAYFSLIFGMALIAEVYLLGRSLFNQQVALWSAALVAFSPYNIWYSQEVRMYTLGAFLGVLAVYFALRGVFSTQRKMLHWLVYAFVSAAGLYVLYYFAFLLIALNLFLVGAMLLTLPQKKGAISAWLIANGTIIILYLPWLGTAYRQATNPPVPVWRSFVPLPAIILESWSALSLGESILPGQLSLLLLLTFGLYGLGLFVARSNWKRILLPLLTFGPLALIVFLPYVTGSPLYHVRYLFTYSAFFYIVLAVSLAWLWKRQKIIGLLISLSLLSGAIFSIYQLHTNPRFAADDLRGAVRFIEARWQPGDVIIANAGYTYTALQYYLSGPADGFERLTNFKAQTAQTNPYRPLILQTGSINGPLSLGWGDPEADFYPMSEQETATALQAVSQSYPRIWMLRAYDTVVDEPGFIRRWLSKNTRLFEDQPFSGNANIRVQGFLSQNQPAPPQPVEAQFEDRFILRGFTPPGPDYRPGETIYTALWLTAATDLSADAPYAISLKLWDSAGNAIAQSDEWPLGSLYFTPNWPPGEVIRHPMRLILPPDIAPGQYWLDAVIYHTDSGQPLTVTESGQSSFPLGGIFVE